MYCSKCGTQNDDTSKFCLSCGNALKAPIDIPGEDPASIGSPYGQQGTPPPMEVPSAVPMAVPSTAPAYAPRPSKPYRAEFTLGLVGAIIGCVIFFILAIVSISELMGDLYSDSYYGDYIEGLVTLTTVFCLASFILGFVGSAQINKQNLKGGIPLIIGGCLGFISMYITPFGLFTLLFWPLILAGGITALARKSSLQKTNSYPQ